jgi:hypothetical protein
VIVFNARAAGNVVTSFLIAPSVTPWETTLPGVMGGAGNNPSVRLVKYDRATGQVLDIDQFYLDLVAANTHGRSNWTLAYRFTSYFGVPDVGTGSLAALAKSFWTDDAKFGKYYAINDVYYEDSNPWTSAERVVHCCAIQYVDYALYESCKANNTQVTVNAVASVRVSATTMLLVTSVWTLLMA